MEKRLSPLLDLVYFPEKRLQKRLSPLWDLVYFSELVLCTGTLVQGTFFFAFCKS